ncbi:MAG: putative modification [Ignavibacteria bacterium]|nr:MAG: putative modification [Ignavibacteria bacterium]
MKVTAANCINLDFDKIKEAKSWNKEVSNELKMHKIHVYPAKFPSFLISKSINYARINDINIQTIGDIFCGCGTTALEAKRNGVNFWGCDINPVATLITKVKTEFYNEKLLLRYYQLITEKFQTINLIVPKKINDHERINFWFEKCQIKKLYTLQEIIKASTPKGKYQNFFLVAFSNILKGASKWLTKSIKPTIDKNKEIKDVERLFRIQFNLMLKASIEYNNKITNKTQTTIVTNNFLGTKINKTLVDLLITSPPYVTSYEYADLHQLSLLWLGYTNDFRTLRNGTIGSVYHQEISDESIENDVNDIGKGIYADLVRAKKSKAKSVAKYFIDIKKSVRKSYSIINNGGLAVYVIGNTKYKNVYVDNAKYITKCMFDSGFKEVEVLKRSISSKILSPYRDADGKFSNDKRKRKVYNCEFILIAKK